MLKKNLSRSSVYSEENDERDDALTALTPAPAPGGGRSEFSSGKRRVPKFPGDMDSFDSFANDGDVYEV